MVGPRDYTVGTRAALTHYSGGLCYFPGCPQPVLRHVEGEPRIIVEIAHIHAAEHNGPRYMEKMTVDERRHFSNLMLFCDPHHDLVDDRPDYYTATMLFRWKDQREAEPREALQRLREVTPAGLRKIVADGLEQHDIKMLQALDRLERKDRDAYVLMRSLVDELAEAYSLRRRQALDPDTVSSFRKAVKDLRGSGLDPDTVGTLSKAVRELRSLSSTLEAFSSAARTLRRRLPDSER